MPDASRSEPAEVWRCHYGPVETAPFAAEEPLVP